MTDSTRSLLLLWGSHTKPGRSGLTVRAIVRAAMELADSVGWEGIPMRRVAERLGVGTMSLYTHVPGKAELTDLMVDAALGELYEDIDEPARQPGGWRGGLTFVARRNWELYERHPWLLQAIDPRPALGPHAVRKYEAELRPLDGIGLSDVEMDSVLSLVGTFVEGAARSQSRLEAVRRAQSDDEWWLEQAPVLERVMRGVDLPVAARVGQASSEFYQGVQDPTHGFGFGLERILDGIEFLVNAAQDGT